MEEDDKASGASISIHAPLAGCDDTSAASITATTDFNPRTPCGVRLTLTIGITN